MRVEAFFAFASRTSIALDRLELSVLEVDELADRLPTVVHAAWLYYQDGLTQAEIASQLAVSRATVGRLLEEARKRGIVTFQFHSDQLQALSLSEELTEAFGLRGAVVIPDVAGSGDPRTIGDRVAKGAAQYLASQVPSESVVAIGWGYTVTRTLAALQQIFAGELSLVTMTGGANAYIEAILGDGADRQSSSARVRARVLPAPIIASSADLAAALYAENEVQGILQESMDAPFALVGVGTPTPGSTLVKSGYVMAEELEEIVSAGAVGDVIGQFFDDEGEVLDLPIHRRRVGLDLADLRVLPNVIGVAGGELKVRALMAATYGGHLDVLITDEITARTMLIRHGEDPDRL